MKKLFLAPFLLCIGLINAQVGINTANPVNTLDINGDVNVRKELRTGGTNLLRGSAGIPGDILHNNSGMDANDWKSIKIADGQGSMSVFSINTVADQTGVTFTGNGQTNNPYKENAPLSNSWAVISGATDTFSITNAVNKVTFSFQTTAQKDGSGAATFACGIFVDNLLKAVRTEILMGDPGAYKIFNLNATLENLQQRNQYSVKVACIKRNLGTNRLGIGTATNSAFLNSDMAQSVLTTSVLQPY